VDLSPGVNSGGAFRTYDLAFTSGQYGVLLPLRTCREKELRIYLEDKIIERYKELSTARHIIA
jgi:hypothetical protein